MRKVLLVLLILPFGLQAQLQDSVKKRSDAIRFADAAIKIQTSPTRWKGQDWLKFGGVLAATAALTQADMPMRDFSQQGKNQVLDKIDALGNHYGKPYGAFLATGGFYLTGLVIKNDWAKETGLILATGLLSAGLIETTLKPVIGRARPETETGNYDFTFFNRKPSFHSFPSGHASIAFTTSFILAKRVKSVPLKIVIYSLAASTAICRIYSDAHWVSDVAFGSVIGWFCSEAALKALDANRYKTIRPKKIKWEVEPYLSGLSLRASF